MTKKKRSHPDVEEILQRPWCYYCERDFDDLKILISHQKAKHFKCQNCGRRLNTAGGLSVHLNQVHKETLTQVENALPNRIDVNVEIFGMEGIPEDVMSAHQQRVTAAFFRHEAERRAATGNPPPGGNMQGEGGPSKKPKIESAEEIKQRLAEHKARKEAERLGLVSNPATPANVGGYGAPAATAPMATSPDAVAPFQPPYGMPNSGSPPQGYERYAPPPPGGYHGFSGSPSIPLPFPIPPSLSPAGPPMPMHGYPGPPRSFLPQQAFIPASPMGYGQPPSAGPQPPFSAGPQMGYGQPPLPADPYRQQWSPSGSPPPPPPPSGPPMSAPGMTPGLPQPSPGLPQRPAFQAPNLSKEEMAKMHAGAPGQPPRPSAPGQPVRHANGGWNFSSQPPQPTPQPTIKQEDTDTTLGDSVDDLINSVTGQGAYARPRSPYAEARPPPAHRQPGYRSDRPDRSGTTRSIKQESPSPDPIPVEAPRGHRFRMTHPIKPESPDPDPEPVEVKALSGPLAVDEEPIIGKKEKRKKKHHAETSKLVYSDEVTAPEEKMAQMPRYAFQRVEHTETVLGDLSGAVTGATNDTVRDPQD
ncbi:hypothetical protein LTR85_003932 [Meristemomyces frigidus]|nr:hypothetical protein LTR85_003932 [Meristemomyces frigidus]